MHINDPNSLAVHHLAQTEIACKKKQSFVFFNEINVHMFGMSHTLTDRDVTLTLLHSR